MFKKIIINTSWLTLGQAGARIFKFLVVLYAVHMLRIEGYGLFAYSLAYTSLFFIAVSLLHTLSPLQREMASAPENIPALLGKHLSWRLWIVVVTAVTAVATSFFFPGLSLVVILLLSMSLAFDFMRDIFGAAFQAGEYMKEESFSLIAQSTGTLLATLVLFSIFPTVIVLSLSYLIGSVVGILVTIYFFRKRYSLSGVLGKLQRLKFLFIKEYVPLSLGIGIAWMLAVTLLVQFATFIAGIYLDPASVGVISILLTLVQVALVPFTMLGASVLPMLSRQDSESAEVSIVSFSSMLLGIVTLVAIPLIPILVPYLLAEYFWVPIVYLTLAMSVFGCMFVVYFYIFIAQQKWKNVVTASLSIAGTGALGLLISLHYHSMNAFFITFTAIYFLFQSLFSYYLFKKYQANVQMKKHLLNSYLFLVYIGLVIALTIKTNKIIIATTLVLLGSAIFYLRIKSLLKKKIIIKTV